ncbi:2-hydroxycarboxylate transporter family protein [Microbacterium enclense]|uniref:Na+/citrate or Na+/malate symporter n=1 Tax=Microbacterium enclense TaxID=993073 RepID=A0A1G6R662_9MICO|nr:2-hydroxycarboxylate transporter family protein [Microbacterium enclense]KSU51785.1 malate permease [Microbacterium enclense]SDC99565.1 Na+/citrate or Na+/malate symporter [Microbacterium enclense]
MSHTTQKPKTAQDIPRWRRAWWKLMDFDVGIIPLPIYILLIALMVVFSLIDGIGTELAFVIAIAAVFAFTLGEIGNRLPLLRQIGGGAILVTFLPSLLGFLGWIPEPMVTAVGDFFNDTKVLNLFIAAVIVGSILSMDRSILIKGFVKIFIPLIAGTLLATGVGMLSGLLFGIGAHDTFFYILVPIMAGGVGEGAIPLTLGYSQITGADQGELLARVLPAIMVGNLTAVILSGLLSFIGKRIPRLTGNGELAPHKIDIDSDADSVKLTGKDMVKAVAAAGMVAVSLYLVGVLAHEILSWPAPVVMLFLAVGLTLAHLVSPRIKAGSKIVYQFAITACAFPILFTFSLTLTPWESLIQGFAPANLVTIVLTVTGMVAGGFLASRLVKLYPIEAAIVTATHSGMGGAGDIAILTASNRMQLMPFAQIATRIGGGLTVAAALILYAFIGA